MQLQATPWFDVIGWSVGVRNFFEPRRAVTIRHLAEVTREMRAAIEARAAQVENRAQAA